jgi:predicted Zn-dependent peptidase
MHRKTTLASGLRVVTETLEGTKAVTALVLVKAGSRWESKEINGLSHFLEHMFFKGAKKYKNAKAVSEAIDGVGGEFNAFTGKEYAGYYVKVAAEQAGLALDVLSDMMLHARFDQEEIEKERGVILEEYNMYQDTPMYQVAWDFEKVMFGDQPLGWDEIGTKENIRRFGREDFVAYKEELYVPGNMVLCLSGAIEHDEATELAQKYFDMEEQARGREMVPFDRAIAKLAGGELGADGAPGGQLVSERVTIHQKKTEQAHLVLGVPGLRAEDSDFYVLKVLAAILGGNMSSRMFLAVREAKGLAYYISTGTENYLDTGALYTRAGVDTTRIEDAVQAILEEYDKIRYVEVPEDELKKGKEFLKGKLTLSLEDSETVAQMHARHELLYDKVRTYAEIIKAIDEVTAEDVKRVASDLLKDEALHLAVIGPYEDAGRFAEILKF